MKTNATPPFKIVHQAFITVGQTVEKAKSPAKTSANKIYLHNIDEYSTLNYVAVTGFSYNGYPFQFILAINAADKESAFTTAHIITRIITQQFNTSKDDELLKGMIQQIDREIKPLYQSFTLALTATVTAGYHNKKIAFSNGDFTIAKRTASGTEIITGPAGFSLGGDTKILGFHTIPFDQRKIFDAKPGDEICCVLGKDINRSFKPSKRSLFKKLSRHKRQKLILSSVNIPYFEEINANINYVNSHDHTLTKILVGLGTVTALAGATYPILTAFSSAALVKTALGATVAGFLALNWWIILAAGAGLILSAGVSYLLIESSLFNKATINDADATLEQNTTKTPI